MIFTDMNVFLCVSASHGSMRVEDESSSLSTSYCEESSTQDELCFSDCEDTAPERSPHAHVRSSTSSLLPSSASHPLMSPASPTESVESGSSFLVNNSWHYSFKVLWNKIPSSTKKLLDDEKRPSAAERREVMRILVAEILAVCKKPGKRHITEISRQIVMQYPKSFRDEIEGQVVGTGYDSLVKQLVSWIDNY